MASERNSDGSYDAVDSGGYGKDYHGQDAFGENIGGTGVGGSHFGGFEEGHFGVGDGRDHFEREATSYGDITQTEVPDTSAFEGEEEVGSDMRNSLRDLNSETTENSNTGSMDTSFQIGGTEDELTKAKERLKKAEEEFDTAPDKHEYEQNRLDELNKTFSENIDKMKSKNLLDKLSNVNNALSRSTLNELVKTADKLGIDIDAGGLMEKFNSAVGADNLADILTEGKEKLVSGYRDKINKEYESKKSEYEKAKAEVERLESSASDSTKSSFTDKMKEDKPKETNMSKATPGKSDYETKANKDSTKEVPKESPSRNDFGNHAMDTLKGATDKLTDSFTKDALGLKSVEEFARENGYNPEKLSTMRAYQAYQNREIMKAIPGVVKQVGGYIVERIKDAFDPSQLPERVRNTLARYNIATLVGAVILSANSGAGLQASIDQALTIVDPEDQTAVSDFLEDVLKDRDTVKDLSNAIDGALAPEENSDTSKLDEEIVNIGRKNNTDYDDFNAGLGSSGTTSDADVKVFIARNIKADPILRRMVEKLGK